MGDSIQTERLHRFLYRLLDIYSPSGKEREVLEFVRTDLRRRGLPVTVQAVDEHRYNLLVLPPDAEVQLALVGHLDTVTAYDLERFGVSQQGDRIQGLGAADMKGGCAAMVEAFLGLWETESGSRAPVALCLLVGEEETGDGAERLVKSYHFPWAVVGEPTDLMPCLECYGYVEVQLTSRGQRRHASLAGQQPGAVEVLLQHMLRLTQHMAEAHPDINYNIRDLFSNRAGFAVPEQCEAWLDLHLPPGAAVGDLLAELEGVSIGGGTEEETVEVRFRAATIEAGFSLPAKGPLVESLQAVFGRRGLKWRPEAFISHSDANRLWSAGVRPIVLGPGQLAAAHTADEAVSFDQICQAARIYQDLILQMTGGSGLAAAFQG